MKSYKSPFSILAYPAGQPLPDSWQDTIRKRRKELLAEFDLHKAPDLEIAGVRWTKSEVLQALEELSHMSYGLDQFIWERGWADFWAGRLPVPTTLSDPDCWLHPWGVTARNALVERLRQRFHAHLRRSETRPILELLDFPWALSPDEQLNAFQPVETMIVEQQMLWIRRGMEFPIMRAPSEEEKARFKSWFPVTHLDLLVALPERFGDLCGGWASSLLSNLTRLASKIPHEERQHMFLRFPPNPHWPEHVQHLWREFDIELSKKKGFYPKSTPSKRKASLVRLAWILGGVGLGGFISSLPSTKTNYQDYKNLIDLSIPVVPYTPKLDSINALVDSISFPQVDTTKLHEIRQRLATYKDSLTLPQRDSISQSTP